MARWKEILPNFPGYFISDDGRVIGRLGDEMTLQDKGKGYLRVNARRRDGKRVTLRINRLVCWYFNGPWPDDGKYYQAAHLDCNPFNNNHWNLEWQTPKQNSSHPLTRARISKAKKKGLP